ncbi:hypothetical protein PRZ48_012545 [Zasmidium cellare]|uniref:Alpha/beta hydrolase fold-3 domain-containing protein n=1 Tax=Zasmidium cellare TaxID=395010 RepID=A0ABR0E560_ZASCE|nr:hypothetical protein PRZ48_012545 [Zasmidium cellare]
MGTVDPVLAAEVKKYPPFKHEADTLAERTVRAEHLAKLRHLYPIPGPIPEYVSESMHHVEARDGYQIPVKIYKPVKPPQDGGSPLVIMLHEGGWAMGDLTDEDLNCRMFSRDLGATCVNVDYRLAPEHPWPCCVWDCYDVIKWAAKTAFPGSAELPADPKTGFIVGGASAGGNLSAVMCQIGRDEGLNPPLTGQYLCVPSLLWQDVVPEEYKEDYQSRYNSGLNDPILGDLVKVTMPPNIAGEGNSTPLFSPLIHPNMKNLPPCFLQVGGLDPLRDEAIIWDRVFKENGGKSNLKVYDGYGHMFWTNWPLMEQSTKFVQDTLEGFKWLLREGGSS